MNAHEVEIENSVIDQQTKITSKETKEKMATTGKEPKKESAMIAPTTGKRLQQPRTMLDIFVAVMLFTLYSVIRYTIKFDAHPPATRERPVIVLA